MCINSFVGYWWKFVTDPEFQEQQAWMQPVMWFFGLLPPNAWTSMRVPGGLVVWWLMQNGFHISALIAFILFVLTDWADGKSARYRKQVTANGGIFDGVADKCLVIPIMGYLIMRILPQCYSYWEVIVPALFLLMAASEGSRLFMWFSKRFDKKKHFHAIWYGKCKFGVQTILVVLLWLAVFIFPGWPWWPIWASFFLVAALVLSIFSIVFRLYPEFEKYAADVVTSGNLSCGALAVLFTWAGEVKTSVGLILIAGVLDMADGLIARKTKPPKEKPGLTFGNKADDVGDGVSFALAPAAILYFLGKTTSAVIYLVATLGRLYFFTDQEKKGKSIPGVFRGVPSPAAAIFLGSFLLWEHPISSETIAIIAVVLAVLEVSFLFPWYQFRWYHFRMIPRVPLLEKVAAGILGTFAFFFIGSGEALSVLSILYLTFFFYPVANRRWDWNKN
ncbi:MAG: CDP-alcohol phosphatidyltransferase family protein [Parcubacteria group bacterium]|jgi:CDP-diacylglycerol--serine O-phosphatidyltransferase